MDHTLIMQVLNAFSYLQYLSGGINNHTKQKAEYQYPCFNFGHPRIPIMSPVAQGTVLHEWRN